jgi:hypothetical protein
MEYLNIPKWNIMSWTLINFLFVCPSIAEMIIGVMMKMMQTSIVCMNMRNIHILKSYIDVILVSDISSMHAYPEKHPYNRHNCYELPGSIFTIDWANPTNISCWAKWCCLSRDVKSAWHRIGARGAQLSCLNSGIME